MRPPVRPRRLPIRRPFVPRPKQPYEAFSFPNIFQSVNSVPTIGKAFPTNSTSLEITCPHEMIRTPVKTAAALNVDADDAFVDSSPSSYDISEGNTLFGD